MRGARNRSRAGLAQMLLIPNYVGPSLIEGVGVFAAAPIARGTVIWKIDQRFDLVFAEADLAALESEQRGFVDRYGYSHTTRPGFLILELDNGRFMNHAEHPNTAFTDPVIGWAIRDIADGEEITCNYAEFEPSFEMMPGRRFTAASAAPHPAPTSP